ncbi:MAG: anti-sigma factor [Cytophagales bacterium]|nr:anti-sigma factor [Cytophagales bacterium]
METLQLILDGENTQYSKEELSKKLENCMPCFNHFQLAKCLKESLQEKLHQKEVPLELIDKIRMEIKTLA